MTKEKKRNNRSNRTTQPGKFQKSWRRMKIKKPVNIERCYQIKSSF